MKVHRNPLLKMKRPPGGHLNPGRESTPIHWAGFLVPPDLQRPLSGGLNNNCLMDGNGETLRIQICPIGKGLTLESYCGDGIGTIKPTKIGKGPWILREIIFIPPSSFL